MNRTAQARTKESDRNRKDLQTMSAPRERGSFFNWVIALLFTLPPSIGGAVIAYFASDRSPGVAAAALTVGVVIGMAGYALMARSRTE